MSTEPRFIGYDVRVRPRDVEPWNDSRRRGFLLRLNAPTPLSVDTAVWPHPHGFDLDALHKSFGLSFVDLTEKPCSCGAPSEAGVAISVYPERWSRVQKDQWDELVLDVNHGTCGLEELDRRSVQPPPMESYAPLGYDVADCGLISGLSNCGYGVDEPVARYRQQWGPRLNAHHLLDDVDDAHEFVEFANRRVPEHAPFFVFGLWCRTD